MTARWPDPDRTIIDHYLLGLGLRSTKSRACYRQVLHGFQDVAEGHSGLGQDVLVVWLRASAECWAATTLLHRTRIIDRFLDHLLKTKAIDRNPITTLREAYNIKQCMPIWRALASRNPDRALAELRQPRPLGSVLGEILAEHVALMRNRGYKYSSQSARLLRFDQFLQLNPALQKQPIGVMLDHWTAAKSTRNQAAECENLRRALTKIFRHRDPSIPSRRPDSRPKKEAVKQWRKPHIYSPADVRRMLDVARSYPSPRSPLRPQAIYVTPARCTPSRPLMTSARSLSGLTMLPSKALRFTCVPIQRKSSQPWSHQCCSPAGSERPTRCSQCSATSVTEENMRSDTGDKWLAARNKLPATLHNHALCIIAEVDRLGRHKYLHTVRRVDHSAAAISAMRVAGVSAAKLIVTPPLSSSTLVKLMEGAGTTSSGLGSAICTGTKSMPSKLGKTSLPIRAIRRQSETLLGIKSYRLATPFTVAPSISVSATIRAFSSIGHRRLPSELRGILARNSFVASIEKLPSNL